MDLKDNYSGRFPDRARILLAKYSGPLAGIKLRRPEPPKVPPELPENISRKYPVFQELTAARQEIQDEFSKMQIEVADIQARLEDDISAISKNNPAKPPEKVPAAPLKEPVRFRHTVALRTVARSLFSGPAGEPRSTQSRPGQNSSSLPPPSGDGAAAASPLYPALVLAAAAVCAAAFGLFRFYGGAAESSFTLPPTRAAGLCLDREGEHVFFADPQRQLLFTVSVPEKKVKSMQAFPSLGLKGLAFDGIVFWSTDGKSIYRHDLTGNYAVLGVYKAGPGIYSISWDGNNLWAASAGGELTRYSGGESPAQEAVYPMPEGPTAGISVSDGKLWLLDPESGRLSAYKLALKPELLTAAGIKTMLPHGAVSGFSVSGDFLWVIAENPAELVRINLKSVKFR